MPTAPLNLKGKLIEQDAYLLSEERHPDGSPVVVAIVANPKYRALLKEAPTMLAVLEELQQRYTVTGESEGLEVAIDTAFYRRIELAISKARGFFNGLR